MDCYFIEQKESYIQKDFSAKQVNETDRKGEYGSSDIANDETVGQ